MSNMKLQSLALFMGLLTMAKVQANHFRGHNIHKDPSLLSTFFHRLLQPSCDCDQDDNDDFCQDEGGEGAFAFSFSCFCVNNFLRHCQCLNGYMKTTTECILCNNDNRNDWCLEQKGEGYQAVQNLDIFEDPSNPCYHDPDKHCECGASDYRFIDGECTKCNFDTRHEWCRERLGDGAEAVETPQLQDCYDDVTVDCQCKFGYGMMDETCIWCNQNNADGWCQTEGEHSSALAVPGLTCYYDFENHCQCPDGYFNNGRKCEKDCHNRNNKERNDWCFGLGGEGAFALEGIDCYEVFENHCGCFDHYQMANGQCEFVPPENRPALPSTPPYPVQHVGNGGRPAALFPLGLCQGDCDDDSECEGDLVCSKNREAFEPVPGCTGGEEESAGYDYCVRPATDPPETVPPGTPQDQPETPTTTDPPVSEPNPPQPEDDFLLGTPPPMQPEQEEGGDADGDVFYTMKYRGRFQKLQEPGCSFPNPKIIVGCNSSRINMMTFSEPYMECDEPVTDEEGNSVVQCEINCSGGDCTSENFVAASYRQDFADPPDLTKFGEVYFNCEADSLSGNVGGWLEVESTGEGNCDGSGGDEGYSAVFQTAQLGVYCAAEEWHSFYDQFFECNLDSTSTSMGGLYSCTAGKACYDQPCQFTIPNVHVEGDVYKYTPDCIASNDGSPIPQVDAPPALPSSENENEVVKALFQVNSGFFYNDELCTGTVSGFTMTCTNGEIALVEDQSEMSCFKSASNTIECSESLSVPGTDTTRSSVNTARNRFVGVVSYECSSVSEIPQTKIENVASSIQCSSTEAELMTLQVQLGVDCGGDAFVYEDYFFECGQGSRLYTKRDMTCGVEGYVPASGSRDEFGVLSYQNITHGIAVASMETDFRWSLMGAELCLNANDGTVDVAREQEGAGGAAANPDLDSLP